MTQSPEIQRLPPKPEDTFLFWHRLEEEITVIDFNLGGWDTPGTAESRQQVQEWLETTRGKTNDPLIEGKIDAGICILQALKGESIPFNEYINRTMGIMPTEIPKSFLDEKKNELIGLFAIANATYPDKKEDYSWTKKGIEQYARDFTLRQERIEEEFPKTTALFVPKMQELLGYQLKLYYEMSFVSDEDAYWNNWVSTFPEKDHRQGISLRFNLNPKRTQWIQGAIAYQVLHEICAHVFQADQIQKRIEKGELDPFLGLFTVFGPEQFGLEGLAQTLGDFLPKELQDKFYPTIHEKISHKREQLWALVWNNAHIMANNNAVSDQEIIDYIQQYLPNWTPELIMTNIQERRTDPILRAYTYIYGISAYTYMQIAESLSSDEQKLAFLKRMYQGLYTPEQTNEIYQEILTS